MNTNFINKNNSVTTTSIIKKKLNAVNDNEKKMKIENNNDLEMELNNMDKLVKIIADSMREYGRNINNIENLLDFLTGSNSTIQPRVLYILDGNDVFISEPSNTSNPPIIIKNMSYKNVLQNNNRPSDVSSFSTSSSTSSSSSSSSSSLPENSPNSDCATRSHIVIQLVDRMLRRSGTVAFLNVITSKSPFFSLLSHEHEKKIKLLPFNDDNSAEYFMRISPPNFLKLSQEKNITSSSLILSYSQMKFLISLHGNPRAIGLFVSFISHCYDTNNSNLPVRDNEYWIGAANDIYQKVILEKYKEDLTEKNASKDHIQMDRNGDIELMNEKDKDKENEKEKDKCYDFNDTPGFESKSNNRNKINFGLLSSQLPTNTHMNTNINTNTNTGVYTRKVPIVAPDSTLFLSSLPLPPPSSLLSLNRSKVVANAFLLTVPTSCNVSKSDLDLYIHLWADLTASSMKPHTPRTYIEWSNFAPKFENLLFSILSSKIEKKKLLKDSKIQNPQKLIEKNNLIRKLSESDFNFLKQKIKLVSLSSVALSTSTFATSTATTTSNSSTLSLKLMKNNGNIEDDKKLVLSLSSYKIFLSWWLPLLITLRKIKYEFCCVLNPLNLQPQQSTLINNSNIFIKASGSDFTPCPKPSPLVFGFIDRAKAVEILKTGAIKISDPGAYSISHCTVLCYTAVNCIVLYCIVLYCIVLYCTALNCIILHCTVLHCTILYSTVLYCITWYRSSIQFSVV